MSILSAVLLLGLIILLIIWVAYLEDKILKLEQRVDDMTEK